MPILIERPTVIKAAGNKPKLIEEFVGLVNSGHGALSIARIVSPGGWTEPGQRPEFQEITIVLRGLLRVDSEVDEIEVEGGQAVVVDANEYVRYSSPRDEGAEYISVCLPAFSPETVHRDPS